MLELSYQFQSLHDDSHNIYTILYLKHADFTFFKNNFVVCDNYPIHLIIGRRIPMTTSHTILSEAATVFIIMS